MYLEILLPQIGQTYGPPSCIPVDNSYLSWSLHPMLNGEDIPVVWNYDLIQELSYNSEITVAQSGIMKNDLAKTKTYIFSKEDEHRLFNAIRVFFRK